MLFGGRSAEHDISWISASHVLRAVDPRPLRGRADRHHPRRAPSWPHRPRRGRKATARRRGRKATAPRRSHRREGPGLAATGRDIDPLPLLAGGPDRIGLPTVVLPILHGPNGEDGTVQGLLELAGAPLRGCRACWARRWRWTRPWPRRCSGAHGHPPGPVARPCSHHEAFGAPRSRGAARRARPDGVRQARQHGLLDRGVARCDGVRGTPRAAEGHGRGLPLRRRGRGRGTASTGRELECAVLGNDDPRASVVGEIVTERRLLRLRRQVLRRHRHAR